MNVDIFNIFSSLGNNGVGNGKCEPPMCLDPNMSGKYYTQSYQLKTPQEARRFNEILLEVGWLVVLRLNVPVNNFSVISGRSHRFLGN